VGAASNEVHRPALPHLTDIVAPVITNASTQLRETVATTVGLVEEVAAPIPLAGSVTKQVGGTTRDVVDSATRLVSATTYAAAGGVDAIVDQTTTSVLTPVLQTLSTISQPGAAGSSAVPSGGVPSLPGSTGVAAGAPTTTTTAPSACADLPLTSQAENGPAVPPPDGAASAASSTVQSASAIDTTLPVPMSDAGSTVAGSGTGTGSAGGSDLAKVLVERRSHRSAKRVAPKPEAPFRPMPGTPLADPGFSPD
jgi:hypothetical protein